jgi:hypothetical protein
MGYAAFHGKASSLVIPRLVFFPDTALLHHISSGMALRPGTDGITVSPA